MGRIIQQNATNFEALTNGDSYCQLWPPVLPVASTPSDPFAAFVTLAFNFDGANGGTTFTDSSSLAAMGWSASGGAALSTAQQKSGTASLGLSGSAQWIENTAQITAGYLGGGDFCVEAWVNPTNIGGSGRMIFDWGYTTSGTGGWQMYIDSSGHLTFYRSGVGTLVLTGTAVISTGAWTHVAMVRVGNTVTAYVNGVAGGTASNTSTYNGNGVTKAAIGAQVQSRNSGYDWNGYIDLARITVGNARYTGNFTPSAAPF